MTEAIALFELAHIERMDLVEPIADADVVIRELAGAGVRVGVATIKPQPMAELVLSTLGLRDAVAALHGRADDVDPRTKTDLLRAAAADLPGPSPLYVGDHDNDEQAAAALGIPFLRFPQSSWNDVRKAILG
jgi:phosphoglycolate phosphatase-like HAD superfamily hydrolase